MRKHIFKRAQKRPPLLLRLFGAIHAPEYRIIENIKNTSIIN